MIESPYDEWAITNYVYAHCLTPQEPPYSLQKCEDQNRSAIEDYRRKVIAVFYEVKANRTDVGMWGPACVQHGFSFDNSLTKSTFRIPSATGIRLSDAIAQYLADTEHPKWILEEGQWPTNSGCSGTINRTPFEKDDFLMIN